MTQPDCRSHRLLAGVALLADGGVLLVKYHGMPDHQRGWFLPHGLVAHLEHPDAAVRRVLRDQLDLPADGVRLSHIESFKGNDGSWHLVFHYAAVFDATPALTPSDPLAAVQWFPLDGLPARAEVAHHGWALDVLDGVLARIPAAGVPALP